MKYLYAYRNISIPANAITITCCFYAWDSSSGVSMLPWVKIISTSVLLLYIHLFRSRVLYFYMNLGMSRQRFYLSVFLVDVMIFTVAFTFALIMKR